MSLTYRPRYFTDSGIIGTKEFVSRAYREKRKGDRAPGGSQEEQLSCFLATLHPYPKKRIFSLR